MKILNPFNYIDYDYEYMVMRDGATSWFLKLLRYLLVPKNISIAQVYRLQVDTLIISYITS